MRPFVVNGHNGLVFPSNFSAGLDFSVHETLEQLAAVIRRDFAAKAEGDERARLRVALADVRASVRSDNLGEVAAEFDGVRTVERALRVGSIDAIIPAARLRPHLIEALERGMRQTLERALQEAEHG